MKRKRTILLLACVLCLAMLSTIPVLARIRAAPDAPLASFSIPWWTVDGGGGTSTGGVFSLSGTIGQPDASSSSGGAYTVKGGFWGGVIPYAAYMPIVTR
jgi:hypothetical protein